MAVNLLERDEGLTALHRLSGESAAGQGRIAVISGEAGIGKTTLVECFLAQAQTGRQQLVRTLWAACEALFTPCPLGPLYDIARQTTPQLRVLLDGETNRATLFAAVLDELAQSSTIVVIEDIHWADEATLDLIKYLSRRIQQTAMLLILTYRDDELMKDHPLRLVLGDLPARDVTCLQLLPLSEHAVAVLAQQAHRPPGHLYAITGGNPFFLTETLAYDAPGAPRSVSDAVLARIARRSPAARRLLELVAVVPNRIERWLIEALDAWNEAALDECLAVQMLRLDGQTIAFRHELARQAVEGALSPVRRQALNAAILRALLERDVEQASLARLAHHAIATEDAALVLRFAPKAAKQAAAQGAHREAVAHYQTALRYADDLDIEQRAEMQDALSHELYLSGDIPEAAQLCESTLALWKILNRQERVGHNLRRLSRLSFFLGDLPQAKRCGLAAVAILEAQSPTHELAMAYGNMSNLCQVNSDIPGALRWGERAIELAKRLSDTETLCYALNTLGSAMLERSDEAGWTHIERSLTIAIEHGLEEHVARAYYQLSEYKVGLRDYVKAEDYLREGMAYCADRDIMGSWGFALQVIRSRLRLAQDDWRGAEEDAAAILSVPWEDATNRIPALLILGLLRARQGDTGTEAALDAARDLALETGVRSSGPPCDLVSIAAARAEWRWLQGDLAGCVTEAEGGLQLALKQQYPWFVGEVAIWLWRCGKLREAPEKTYLPYALEIAGDWRAAAEAWEWIGCPWERAMALLGGDEAAQRTALNIFQRLGATPAAEIARRKLLQAGVRGLPRGPHQRTRANPQGLTNRQLEILPLLAEGRSNAGIAEQLSTSPRTVEHHVSAVLAKLNARSRAEAVRRAYELGVLSQTPSASTPR